jgi:prepilin-type N-terminal cleavage/methylation domain-containing protein
MYYTKAKAFTLAELLVALLILGQIAAFSIPKILSAQTNSQNKAIAKEIISTAASAVSIAQANGTLTTSSTFDSLTQSMNYVAVDTSSTIDGIPSGSGPMACNNVAYKCLRLHSGALLLYAPSATFVNTTGYVAAIIDADGRLTSQNDSLGIILFYNGRVMDYEAALNNAAYTPTWFSW